jgi:hypothetical protein
MPSVTLRPCSTTDIFVQQGFRSQSYYDLPPATEKEKREDKKYIHVLDEL